MIRQFELVEKVRTYDPAADEERLNRAYVFAMKAHGKQVRASGDPYFSHPLEVAGILADKKLDSATIITALLHDVIEDTDVEPAEIRALFGDEISRLVDGVTKLSQIELQSEQTKQAENFRKLVLAMSEDIRVLLVKLADRLHNMQTLEYIKEPERRRRIATETMDIFAPLAERIGIRDMKDELEDRAFAELHADARQSILARLEFLRSETGGMVDQIIAELNSVMAEAGIKARVAGREKTPYSIWRKMERNNVAFEQLSDVVAFRVIVESVDDCYRALGLIHQKYRVVPGRFKDYVSTPKPNQYKSLHTGVIGPLKKRIELQIRTEDMHRVAELGVAAHWVYKQDVPEFEGRQYRWLRHLLDILEHASGPEEFLEHTKLEMFSHQVFAFTPKGDLIVLPAQATAVDFAYAVHSEVGNTCVGAKVNGRMVPLRTQLSNGDQVEIVTSSGQKPSPIWESFVVTGRARSQIRRFVRSEQRSQYINLGRAIMDKLFRQEGYEFADKSLAGVVGQFRVETEEDLLARVGEGLHTGKEVFEAIFPGHKHVERAETVIPFKGKDRAILRKDRPGTHAVPIKGLTPGLAVHYANCCHPIPGDRIVGIVTAGKGVTIHTIDCDNLESFSDQPDRWLDVAWDSRQTEGESFVGRLQMVVANEPGSLGQLSGVIGKNQGNIINLRFTSRSSGFFDMVMDVEVADIRHLSDIVAALRATPQVNSVERARG